MELALRILKLERKGIHPKFILTCSHVSYIGSHASENINLRRSHSSVWGYSKLSWDQCCCILILKWSRILWVANNGLRSRSFKNIHLNKLCSLKDGGENYSSPSSLSELDTSTNIGNEAHLCTLTAVVLNHFRLKTPLGKS